MADQDNGALLAALAGGGPVPAGSISGANGLLDILHGASAMDCISATFADYVMLWGYLYKDPCDCIVKSKSDEEGGGDGGEEEDKVTEKGTWRLYLSLDFNEYLEFNVRGFAKQIDLFTDANPLAGSLVWLRRTATVRHVREEKAEDEARFLQGAIARGFLGTSGTTGPSTMLGLASFASRPTDPGSGGGCGTGAFFSGCEIRDPRGKQ